MKHHNLHIGGYGKFLALSETEIIRLNDAGSRYPENKMDNNGSALPADQLVQRPQTFGERAVGLSFNPSNDDAVAQCKKEYAVTIDRMNDLRNTSTDPDVKRMTSEAITNAQTAQMWAVKALTWR